MERVLDVSALEAPEPLLRAIEALEAMPGGDYLRLRHRMKPCHLYAVLEKNGLTSDTRRGSTVECEVFIWRDGDQIARDAAMAEATRLEPWRD